MSLDSAIDRFDNRMANLAGEASFINGAGSYHPEPIDVEALIEEFALAPEKTAECITEWADYEIHCSTARALFLAYLCFKNGSVADRPLKERDMLIFAKSLCLNIERGFEKMAEAQK